MASKRMTVALDVKRALRYAISKATEADCGDPLLHIDSVLTVLRREGFEIRALSDSGLDALPGGREAWIGEPEDDRG